MPEKFKVSLWIINLLYVAKNVICFQKICITNIKITLKALESGNSALDQFYNLWIFLNKNHIKHITHGHKLLRIKKDNIQDKILQFEKLTKVQHTVVATIVGGKKRIEEKARYLSIYCLLLSLSIILFYHSYALVWQFPLLNYRYQLCKDKYNIENKQIKATEWRTK